MITGPLRVVFARTHILVSYFCILGALCVSTPCQSFKTIYPGVEYAQVDHKIGIDPVKINLLRLDLTKVRLDVHHAIDKAIGIEKTSSIAFRHGAVAAINAGFFRLDKSRFLGDPNGILMIDGELLSESSNGRINLIVGRGKNGSDVLFEHFNTYTSVRFGFDEGRQLIQISGINRERKRTEMVVYDPRFGQTTLTESSGLEIAITKCKRDRDGWGLALYVCRDVEIKNGGGNQLIPSDGFIISVGLEATELSQLLIKEIQAFNALTKKKQRVLLRNVIRNNGNEFIPDKSVDIVTGVPQLIKNGKIDVTWEQEKASKSFADTRHPRTAVAKMKDGRFLMMTVDGRQPGVSVGMNLNELCGIFAFDRCN